MMCAYITFHNGDYLVIDNVTSCKFLPLRVVLRYVSHNVICEQSFYLLQIDSMQVVRS